MTAPPLCLWRPVLMFDGTGNTRASMLPSPEGHYVTVEDHTAALAAAEARGREHGLQEAADSLLECSVWCDSQERTDDGWRNGVTDARKHHIARILALIPEKETPDE